MTLPPDTIPTAPPSAVALEDDWHNEDDALNPGIRRTVALLRSWDFDTCDSGDGETHEFACDRDYPYVSMRIAPALMIDETDRLVALLRGIGIDVGPLGPEPGGVSVDAVYMPCEGIAIIDLHGLCDDMLPVEADR